jgi:hypothetical protein
MLPAPPEASDYRALGRGLLPIVHWLSGSEQTTIVCPRMLQDGAATEIDECYTVSKIWSFTPS